MRNFINEYFRGPTFWRAFGIGNLLIAVLALFVGASTEFSLIVMWIAFATAEVLTTIQELKEFKTDV
jgi:hypothetical protein